MRKLVAGLLAALLMTAGMVALTSTTASAGRCPYTGCIATDTSGKAVDTKRPGKVRVNYKVRTRAGNTIPSGRVKVIIKGNGVWRGKVRAYPGQNAVRFFRVPNGAYQVFIKYIPGRNTIFRRSLQETVVTVR